jgi:hypothetical protein
VTRESVKEQIFDVSHLGKVKAKLKSLLAGEIVPISEMVHDTEPKEASVDDEGNNNILYHFHITINLTFPSHINRTVRCHVGDWVEVVHDYSPGVCSEGGDWRRDCSG